MSLHGRSRVFTFRDAGSQCAVPVFAAYIILLSTFSEVQGLAPQNQAAATMRQSGVVIQGSGQMAMFSEARKPRILRRPDSEQLLENTQEEAVEEARLEVAEAAMAVQKQEALEAVVEAAEEVTRQREKEEAAEDHLRSAAHILDEVTSKGRTVPASEAVEMAETKTSSNPPACITCKCKFIDRHGMNSDCDSGYALRLLISKWLHPKSTVIEFGAQYGTASCTISTRQHNSGKLVAVEPDHRIWVTLEMNRVNNKCNFTTMRGLVGQEDMKAIETNDAMEYLPINSTDQSAANVIIPHLTLREIQSRYSMQFDAAIIDCDGCLPILVRQNVELFPQLSLLIVAEHNQAEIEKIHKLSEMGNFKEVEVVNHYHVLRRNCGSAAACASPQSLSSSAVDIPRPSIPGPDRPKNHVENL